LKARSPKSAVSSRPKSKGRYTKKGIWDQFLFPPLIRDGEVLDPGVNFFVRSLEMMGIRTHFSCEGHPNNFYITFGASYKKALKIKSAGFFSVEIERPSYWSMRVHMEHTDREKIDCLRWAAEAWAKRFGVPKKEAGGC
jgi:hypothetical protein